MLNGATYPTAVLVHLSDLHFSTDNPGLEARNCLIRDRLLQDIEELLGSEVRRRADAVVVTGDIAYGGRESEYRAAASWFDDVVKPVTNGSTRVLVVPGNHDVEWGRIGPTHESHRAAIACCDDVELDALLDAFLAEDGQPILQPLAAYNEFAASRDCQLEENFAWDAELPIGGGYWIDFRGITTVVNSHRGDAPGGLAVHSNQLLYTPQPGRIPVLLAHHDTFFWRRYGRLGTDVQTRMALALFGHTHTPRLRQLENCVEVTAGAVQPEEGKDWQPTYNVIELGVADVDDLQATVCVRVYRRRYSPEHDRFIPDTAGGLYEERNVTVPSAERDPAAGDADNAGEEKRVALTTPDGEPHPVREVQLGLYDLGAGDRITLLADLGIDVDDLARLPPHRLLPRAAEAVVAEGKLEEFQSAIAARREATEGGDNA